MFASLLIPQVAFLTAETIINNAEIYRGVELPGARGGRHRGQTGRLFASIAPSLIIALSEFGTLGRSVMTRHSCDWASFRIADEVRGSSCCSR